MYAHNDEENGRQDRVGYRSFRVWSFQSRRSGRRNESVQKKGFCSVESEAGARDRVAQLAKKLSVAMKECFDGTGKQLNGPTGEPRIAKSGCGRGKVTHLVAEMEARDESVAMMTKRGDARRCASATPLSACLMPH